MFKVLAHYYLLGGLDDMLSFDGHPGELGDCSGPKPTPGRVVQLRNSRTPGQKPEPCRM